MPTPKRLPFAIVAATACSFDTSGVGSGEVDGVASEESSAADPATTTDSITTSSSSGESSTAAADESTSSAATTADASESSETTGADPCTVCDVDATCVVDDGAAQCTCPVGTEGDGRSCVTTPALAQLRVEMPCGIDLGSTCAVALDGNGDSTMIGEPGSVYQVALRIRGVTEIKDYSGAGEPDGSWLEGGTLGFDGVGSVTLEISDPPQLYRLNAAASGLGGGAPILVDYTRTISIATDASVHLAMSSIDFTQAENPGIVIPEVPPADAFDGQLVQIDIEMIAQP